MFLNIIHSTPLPDNPTGKAYKPEKQGYLRTMGSKDTFEMLIT